MAKKIESNKKFNKPIKNASVLFKNAKIIDVVQDKIIDGEILVLNGLIEDFGKRINSKIPSDIEIVDCKGNYIAPGLIEMQVHIGESGGGFKENIYNATKAAVAGGITTICVMPDMKPVIDTTMMVEYIKNRAKQKAFCNVSIFGSISKDLKGHDISEIGLMKKAGIVGVSDGEKNLHDSSVFRNACKYSANFGVMLAHNPQDKHLSEDGVINEGKVSTQLGVKGIPKISEKIGLERDIAIAEETGVRYHALNISTVESAKIIEEAKKRKLKISASVTPHHLLLTEDEALKYRTFAKTMPPLRTDLDLKALKDAIKNDVIDIISCNHCPRSEEQKRLSLSHAEFGVVGLETMFSASYQALTEANMSLPKIISKMTINPAKTLGLEKKGYIDKGCIADLVMIDINETWTVFSEGFSGSSTNSPFDQVELKGKIKKTYVGGVNVYEC